ncbi:MAG: FtsX-like permease family protein [Rhodocyclaceae bacterium]|nr:FtsX-like permease family protein [Rhodocyclaceae bacterium]
MSSITLAWRMLWRDARAGELRLLLAALIIAVGALTAVGFFTDRVARALAQEANQLLGADLLLISDHPWQVRIANQAVANGLKVAQTQTFPSMVTRGDIAQLGEIKAVSDGYPLRGTLKIAAAPNAPEQVATGIPTKGTVWLDARMAFALNVSVGDRIQLGEREFSVAAILMMEPDRGINFFTLAPRLMLNLDDLAATNLIQNGSRVTYRLLLAGEAGALLDFRRVIEKDLGRGERIEDAQNARPEMRQALDRAQKFLGLSALLTVVLAAVAIALASRRYVQRHLDPCAVMRCLGARQGTLLRLYLLQFGLLAFIGAGLGCVLGYLSHYALYKALAALVLTQLPAPSLLPVIQGMSVGLLLFGFAVPPLLQLQRVPTLRVLRRELGAPGRGLLVGYVLCAFTLAGLMLWIAGELKLGLYVVGGFAIAVFVFSLLAWLALSGLGRLRNQTWLLGSGARYALAGVQRHRRSNVIQIVALALGFMAILLLTVTRGELLDAWRKATPADAPNRFVINIQPDQAAEVGARFAAANLKADLTPMVRGRLMRVNGRSVSAADYSEERAQRLVEREFNLSWREDLPLGNRLTQGQWFFPGSKDEASVEDGLAKTLQLKLGDSLEFDIAGVPVNVRISSLRKLDWDSMRVNFFVLTPPGVLDSHPQSLITSFHLPDGRDDFIAALVHRFPNLTVIDVGAILKQLRSVIDQVAQAVQFVFLFTLAAGVVVLYAALVNVLDERRQELAIMRALGAQQAMLRQSLQVEFAVIGALAGLIASSGALLVGQVLASKVFNFTLATAWWLPLIAAIVGAILVPLAAVLASRQLLSARPLEALRTV